MPEPLDLDALRERHERGEQINLSWPQEMARQAHADRGALLAHVEEMADYLDAITVAATEDHAARARVDAALIRADGHRVRLLAMLDSLAALTVEEVAQTIADCAPNADWAPDMGGRVTRIERDTAAAVIALVQARVAGPNG